MRRHVLLGASAGRFAGVVIAFGLVVLSGSAVAAPGGVEAPEFGWLPVDSGTDNALTTLDVVSTDVVWAGSLDTQVIRTIDGGVTFTDVTPTGFDPGFGLYVSDIEAWSADDAMVVAAQDGDTTKIYRTDDGGESWAEVYTAVLPAYINCIGMFDRRHGFAMGDPVDGKFQIISTSDAGRTWDLLPNDGMPEADEDEYGLAFGGDCATATGRKAFFGTWLQGLGKIVRTPWSAPRLSAGGSGGKPPLARIFHSTDFGLTWEVTSTLIPCCVRSLDFRTNRLGIAIGGMDEDGPDNLVARTTDGGTTWDPVDDPALTLSPADVAWWSDAHGDQRVPEAKKIVFAVGTDSVVSRDRGKTWEQFDDRGVFVLNIDCLKGTQECWAVGDTGLILRLVVT